MDRLGPELRSRIGEVVRAAGHPHSPMYGRALAVEEMLKAVEAELTDDRYSETERRSFHQVTLAVLAHGNRMTR
ncbi:hypothetical protein [Nocardia sp. NPDC050175]|uniref:hypothetical protein n=1 Tax=Nocardia sp. NPDC050175 TaxID=3364317 RepID=UPI003788244E